MTLLPPVERRPLYQQVKTALTQKLINGEWRPGDKLPAESDLARTVCVSLGTLRRATQELVDEGIFERRAGVGTLVSTFQTRGYWNRFQPLVRTDGTPRFDERRQIVFETVPAPEFVATVLNLALGAPVLRTKTISFPRSFPNLPKPRFSCGFTPTIHSTSFMTENSASSSFGRNVKPVSKQ